MRISQVAEKAGVNPETLRFYERRGLLPEPERTPSRYRAYGPETVLTIRFIKRAQELGFTLGEVEALLHLAAGGPESCDEVQALARQKLRLLDEKIASLRAMRDSVRRLVATCELPREQRDCPLIHALADEAAP